MLLQKFLWIFILFLLILNYAEGVNGKKKGENVKESGVKKEKEIVGKSVGKQKWIDSAFSHSKNKGQPMMGYQNKSPTTSKFHQTNPQSSQGINIGGSKTGKLIFNLVDKQKVK